MDARYDEIFSSLRQRIKSLITLYEEQKAKASNLQKKSTELHQQVQLLENKLTDLEKKHENLKIAKVLSSVPGEDVHETKIQVNRIVREIDKCIALLNR
jgi:DNA integrity scanning protein DisA with diadenylate cyclase activity